MACNSKLNYNQLYSKAYEEIKEGHYNEAIKLLDKAILIKYKADSLYTLKSFCLYKTGYFEEAKVQADRALVYNPLNDYAYYLLGIVKREINVFGTVNLSVNRSQMNYYEGLAYMRYEILENSNAAETKVYDLTASLTDLCKAIELNDSVADNYYERAKTLQKVRLYDKALKDFNRAIELSKDIAEFFFGRAMFYKETEKTQLSLNDFNRAIELEENPFFYANRAYLKREQLHDEIGACKDLKKADKLGLKLETGDDCN